MIKEKEKFSFMDPIADIEIAPFIIHLSENDDFNIIVMKCNKYPGIWKIV